MIRSSFVVRAAVGDEVAACVDLWVRAVAVRDGLPESEAVRERARSKFDVPRVALLVASSGPDRTSVDRSAGTTGVAGFALVTAPGTGRDGDPEDAAYLSLLAVDPRAQGHGLGRSLLRAAVAEAGAAGHGRSLLHALDDNAPALRLYRSAGFRPVGDPFPHALNGQPTRVWVADGVVAGDG
ncbi:GNAT family N-acetyltransferase [Curtobacterium sp. A7_M15]|uniref:GNAT family N-acetyltransferase n=1 Tax=Curtobacterium sp. A7_M15 TaxID=3065241 RepID=UPI002737F6F3|nr:GNAT family N-acetyltransferase [Curtobacterium sp. A7_M15]MDP4333274.1 GNAT family N-acetyltransferase [Curtobacterium sp. A7_M15]